jgi:hypothetical protein
MFLCTQTNGKSQNSGVRRLAPALAMSVSESAGQDYNVVSLSPLSKPTRLERNGNVPMAPPGGFGIFDAPSKTMRSELMCASNYSP